MKTLRRVIYFVGNTNLFHVHARIPVHILVRMFVRFWIIFYTHLPLHLVCDGQWNLFFQEMEQRCIQIHEKKLMLFRNPFFHRFHWTIIDISYSDWGCFSKTKTKTKKSHFTSGKLRNSVFRMYENCYFISMYYMECAPDFGKKLKSVLIDTYSMSWSEYCCASFIAHLAALSAMMINFRLKSKFIFHFGGPEVSFVNQERKSIFLFFFPFLHSTSMK